MTLNKDYDKKVCNNEPTCNMTTNPNLDPNRLTLHKRDCMCDFECAEYGDCCKDSQYVSAPEISAEKKTYYCPPESNQYTVVSCASDYADADIKAKCARALLPPDEYNTAVVTPVTNLAKRTTYANAYCALCNNENDFELWERLLGCYEAQEGDLTVKSAPVDNSNNQTSAAASTAKPDNSVKLNLHFDPGSVLSGNKDSNSGFNKDIKIPTFGLSSKAINKTVGSDTGLFGAKISRSKRQTSQSHDYRKYTSKIEEIKKLVKYDSTYQELTAQYDGKLLVCKMSSKLPDTLKSHIRVCVPNLISECVNDSTKVCPAYTEIVYEKKTKQAYRNKECALCNGVASTALTGCPQAVRAGASSLFTSTGKAAGDDSACKDGSLAAKFC